ncbi:MAG: Tfp pilus assembly protein FimT [Candidatus Moranbacteria bacterium GW2011_GWA2_39_41]|nr:MAG: Tfp pilus assembly protein FimT [Candidatus Moranbacteria bacterium GW2011_GWA2_39_41]
MFIQKIKTNRAFTLVEFLVVIAFMGIMTAVSLVSFYDSKNKKAVETEARKVAAVVREAQNYALTGKNASAGCGNEYTFTYGGSEYGIIGCVTESYSLIGGVSFNTNSSFSFSVPWGNASEAKTIAVEKGNDKYNICVYQSGKIVEKKDDCW